MICWKFTIVRVPRTVLGKHNHSGPERPNVTKCNSEQMPRVPNEVARKSVGQYNTEPWGLQTLKHNDVYNDTVTPCTRRNILTIMPRTIRIKCRQANAELKDETLLLWTCLSCEASRRAT